MPAGAFVKDEVFPLMPPGAFFKEEVVVKQEHAFVAAEGAGRSDGMCRYGEPSSLDQVGPSSHYACWEAAGGRSHHLCTLPQGHMGEHQLPQLGRTRKRAASISIDLD
eukprot:scaffold45201_cov60-Phaeocystis_antarctica.AAC.2